MSSQGGGKARDKRSHRNKPYERRQVSRAPTRCAIYVELAVRLICGNLKWQIYLHFLIMWMLNMLMFTPRLVQFELAGTCFWKTKNKLGWRIRITVQIPSSPYSQFDMLLAVLYFAFHVTLIHFMYEGYVLKMTRTGVFHVVTIWKWCWEDQEHLKIWRVWIMFSSFHSMQCWVFIKLR